MTEEKIMEEKIEKVKNLLGGFNCGACGYENCKELAIAICEKKASPEECLPIDEENIETIKEIVK